MPYDSSKNTKNAQTIRVFANNNQFKECNLFVKTSFNIGISLHSRSKNSSAHELHKELTQVSNIVRTFTILQDDE